MWKFENYVHRNAHFSDIQILREINESDLECSHIAILTFSKARNFDFGIF